MSALTTSGRSGRFDNMAIDEIATKALLSRKGGRRILCQSLCP